MKDKIKKSKILEWVYTYGYSLYILYFLYLIFMTINNTNISSYVPFAIAILIILCMLLYVIKMFKELDESDPTFIDILLLILLVIIVTLFLSYLLGSINFSVYNFKLVGTQDGWLNVAGALGGGTMTLLGVWYTIREQNKIQESNNKQHEQERKEDLAIQYRPILSFNKKHIEYQKNPFDILLNDIVVKITDDPKHRELINPIIILIENIGRGEALLKDICIESKDNSLYTKIEVPTSENIIIATSKSVKLAFQFSEEMLNGLEIYKMHHILTLNLIYSDLLSLNTYKTTILLQFDASIGNPNIMGLKLKTEVIFSIVNYNEIIKIVKKERSDRK